MGWVPSSAANDFCVWPASQTNSAWYHNALCEYADDTYLIIPAVNVDSRSAELRNVNEGALAIPET